MFRTAAVAAIGLGLLAGPLHAGSDNASDKAAEAALGAGAENQVSVSIDQATLSEEVMTELTAEAGVASQADLPDLVKAPAGVAAEVCQANAEELAQAEDATCEAKTTTTAFNQLMQRQIESGMGIDVGAESEVQMETDTGATTE